MMIKRSMAALGSLTLIFILGLCSSTLSSATSIQKARQDLKKGDDVTLQGVVTHITTDSKGNPTGYYLQDGEDTSTASSAIYVYQKGTEVKKGRTVEVKGKLGEYRNQLQVSGSVTSTDKGAGTLPNPLTLKASKTGYTDAELEKMEGMLVSAEGYVLSKTYSYDYGRRRNNLFIADAIQFKSTQLYPGGQKAEDHAALNKKRRLSVIESGKTQSGQINYYTGFNYWARYLRVGSELGKFEAIMSQRDSNYELLADSVWGESSVTAPTGELARPLAVEGREQSQDIRVASFNLLNWFTDDVVEGAPESSGNRGARSVAEGLVQLEKLTSSIMSLDADILGLLEVGNNGAGEQSAISFLVATLNLLEDDEKKHYQFVYPENSDRIGTDAISVGLIYRPDRVDVKGVVEVLEMPREVSSDGKVVGMRDALIQEFCLKGQAAKCLTIAVNHLKSKRCSGCADDPASGPDEQGCCSRLRSSAAMVLGRHLEERAKVADVILMGDFNANAREDTIRIFTETTIAPAIITSSSAFLANGNPLKQSEEVTTGFGYKPLMPIPEPLPPEDEYPDKIPFSYSYNGELSALDHLLISASLYSKLVKVSGKDKAGDVHVNSLESSQFEYPGRYTGGSEFDGGLPKSRDSFSSSDHDPVWGDFRF